MHQGRRRQKPSSTTKDHQVITTTDKLLQKRLGSTKRGCTSVLQAGPNSNDPERDKTAWQPRLQTPENP